MNAPKKGTSSSKAGKTPEEIVEGFNRLRQEQRNLINKISELENDATEHRLVIDTLAGVDENRRCFRLVGGVLVERTVKEVFPALQTNREQILNACENMKALLQEKGKELQEYRQKYNIRIQGQEEPSASSSKETLTGKSDKGDGKLETPSVLVAEKS